MNNKQYDLIVVGSGAAGFAAAMRANELKAKTLMINNDIVGIGGTCVNVGCVPTKYLLFVSEFLYNVIHHNLKGVSTTLNFDFKTIIDGKNKLLDNLRNEKYISVLENLSHVDYLEGNARIISRNAIEIQGKQYRAERFIISTGSSPFIPNIEGIEKINYLTNKEALQLMELPDSMIVLGAGPQGVELAQIFVRFGTKVSILQRSNQIVRREEPELGKLLERYLKEEGIGIFKNVEIKSIYEKNGKKLVNAEIDGEERIFEADQILVAVGRRANTKNTGLENLGINLGRRGEIIVDGKMKAGENVWAGGDVTGEPMLETVAAKEGMIAANNALMGDEKEMDYSIVPHSIFTDPQLSGVGLTHEQAISKGIKCSCHTIPMALVPKAAITMNTRGAVKIVINNDTKVIIGVQILSKNAADLIHEGVMIVKNRMKIDDVIDTLHVFPTISEAIKISAQSFKRDVRRMACCVE